MKVRKLDNLDLDCIRARQLGYSSYGRYKADHPRTMDEKTIGQGRTDSRKVATCRCCKEVFYTSHSGRLYCSERCAKEYRKQRSEMRKALDKH